MTLARSAGVIGAATMASRILGLVRDQVLAFFFGAGDAMDAFRIAFRIPNLLRDLFAEGALGAALVPTFTRALTTNGHERAWRLASNVLNHLLIVSGIAVLVGILLAEPLVDLYAGGFREIPGKFELTVGLTRIMFPFLSMVMVAAVLAAVLNAAHLFFVPALSPAMFNAATILCTVIFVPLAPRLGTDAITVIAVATLAGGLGQIVIQLPTAMHAGFRYRPIVDSSDPWLREIARLMVPGVVGVAAVQINLLVNSWLATGLGTGAVSWLDYAFRLMYLPIGLIGISIATAALPGISGHAGRHDDAAVRRDVSSALRMMLMLNIPATVGLVVLGRPIVALIFERGQFGPADTAATAAALACYAPGLVGYSVVKLVSPAFYALGNSRVPVATSALSIGVNIVASLALVGVLGHRGLALSTAAAAVVNGALLLWLLAGRLGGLERGRLVEAALKISLASIAMGFAAYHTERVLAGPLDGTAAQALHLFIAITTGIAALVAAAFLLRIEEVQALTRRLSTIRRTW